MIETTQTWKIGDCLELLPKIDSDSINMILTDLPYGITDCAWDSIIPLKPLWKEYKRIISNRGAIVLTGSQPFTTILINSNIEMFKYCWVWVKTMPTNHISAKVRPMTRHEDILVFSKGTIANHSPNLMNYYPQNLKNFNKSLHCSSSKAGNAHGTRPSHKNIIFQKYTNYPNTILKFSNTIHNNIHPTQKPVELFKYLIKTYTNEGDTVHDSCLGSGTTLEACRLTNRNCIGFEISNEWEKYYPERILQHNKKLNEWI